jgi:hypothetical protein
MRLHTKALYNLVRYNYLEDSSINCEKWQVEDLKEVTIEDLFAKLKNLGISIDKQHFLLYADDCNDPEELTECLIVDKKTRAISDQIYLVIFELWRRLLPEKPSISIFCDELDYRIYLYDQDKLENYELMEDAVANLLDILEENIDEGKEPKEVFSSISQYFAHDLESFLYEYIADNIDEDNDAYANDLIENFYQFLSNINWFDFLRVRILAKTDIEIANDILKKIIENEEKNPDIDLSLEIVSFMIREGDPDLFIRLAKLTLKGIKIEEELVELLSATSEFYRRLDLEERSQAITKIINKRKKHSSETKVDPKDKDIEEVELILSKPVEV